MKFSTAANLTKTLIFCSVAFCIFGLLVGSSMPELRALVTLGALLLLIAAVVTALTLCKCPHCGKRIFFGASNVVYCPNCRRNIVTGKKASKKRVERANRD